MALPVNTGLILRHLKPHLTPNEDYSVGVVDGVVYVNWRSVEQQPTEQQIIDAELAAVRAEFIVAVKSTASNKYSQYASSAPGKDAVYAAKQSEAVQYGIDATVGPYMQARINKTGEPATAIAAEWSAKSAAWNALAVQIDAIQDNATQQINAAATVAECETIANAAIAEIEAL